MASLPKKGSCGCASHTCCQSLPPIRSLFSCAAHDQNALVTLKNSLGEGQVSQPCMRLLFWALLRLYTAQGYALHAWLTYCVPLHAPCRVPGGAQG